MRFKMGQTVYSEVYGKGVVVHSYRSRRGTEQYGIVFEKGGPQGWAENATNDVEDLQVIQ